VKTFHLVIILLMLPAAPAHADQIFAGAFIHDVATPLTRSGQEGGVDVQLGWRGDGIQALRAIGAPSPHVYGSANSRGDTNFASAGVSWRFGDMLYVRPGIGIAIHDGKNRDNVTPDRIDFGSRILFAPELGVGVQVSERVSVEASWVHFSHATLFSGQNPGSDNFGVRVAFGF
jgi:opacity protein-like surface antigen